MNLKPVLLIALFAFIPSLRAASLEFDYQDPKEISAVSLSIDSMLEPIVGYAKGISGKVQFDPEHPEKASGKIAVEVASVQFANDGYTETARNFALQGKKFPQLIIALRKVISVKRTGARFEGEVLADFTCRGITKPKQIHLTASYFPGRAEERTNGRHKGDLLILRTKFGVSRKAYGISDGIPDDMVSDTVEVGVAIVGIHYTDAAPVASSPCRVESSVVDLTQSLPVFGGKSLKSMEALRGSENLVIFFVNEQCGVTFYYKDRLLKLIRQYRRKGFVFAGVRVGQKQFADRPVDLPEATYLGIPFLDDDEGRLMEQFKVGQSFTFAVIDRERKLRYFGGLDDSVDPKRVKRTPLADALQALAAGRSPKVTRANAIGCAILPMRRAS